MDMINDIRCQRSLRLKPSEQDVIYKNKTLLFFKFMERRYLPLSVGVKVLL
jgi:hypothetical protein